MNNVEKIEDAIEVEMAEIQTYRGIKRPNSYFVLAQLLNRYVKMCDEKGKMESDREKWRQGEG